MCILRNWVIIGWEKKIDMTLERNLTRDTQKKLLSCHISSKFCHFYEGPMESYKIHYAWEYFLVQDPVQDELVRECDVP
jgi:hypothetical protein